MPAKLTTVDRGPVKAILFDLFQTLVFFDGSKIPRAVIGSEERPATIANLEDRLMSLDPGRTVDAFFDSLKAVHSEIAKEKLSKGVEISSPERFRRTLSHWTTRADRDAVAVLADELTALHMKTLADAVVCPPDRIDLLRSLASEYRIGLVSNFDHGPTAHTVLATHGLDEHLGVRIVSDDIGVVKPDARIFHHACSELGSRPQETLFVGDSKRADVEGAHGAGLTPVWVDSSEDEPGPAALKVADVSELADLLL